MLTSIAACELPMFEIQAHHLHALIADPYSQEMIEVKCNHCPTLITCRRIVSPFVACDPCIARITAERAIAEKREYWLSRCPKLYQHTDINHSEFPRAAYKASRDIPLSRSLLFLGPSGTGKTRVAMLRMKAALVSGLQIKFIWPEQIERYKGFDSEARLESLSSWGMVLLDDPLLTACREPKLADTLKNIIDILIRHERPFIVTSQIGEEDFLNGNTYGDLKNSDRERGLAIMRRLKEYCEIIKFMSPASFTTTQAEVVAGRRMTA